MNNEEQKPESPSSSEQKDPYTKGYMQGISDMVNKPKIEEMQAEISQLKSELAEKDKEWPTTQGLSAGVWVNASERQPEDSNLRLGKLNGKPVLVTVSKLIDGYISCNGHIEPVIFVEWLDETIHPSVNGWSEKSENNKNEL